MYLGEVKEGEKDGGANGGVWGCQSVLNQVFCASFSVTKENNADEECRPIDACHLIRYTF